MSPLLTFDIFNRHAEKIEMANIAQTINCLHSLFADKVGLTALAAHVSGDTATVTIPQHAVVAVSLQLV